MFNSLGELGCVAKVIQSGLRDWSRSLAPRQVTKFITLTEAALMGFYEMCYEAQAKTLGNLLGWFVGCAVTNYAT